MSGPPRRSGRARSVRRERRVRVVAAVVALAMLLPIVAATVDAVSG